ncbi:hypothetical protein [Halomicronema sp. CCY15110]|nr:hypothetical protein [Halomicronema sp. CCY15110]
MSICSKSITTPADQWVGSEPHRAQARHAEVSAGDPGDLELLFHED